MMGRCVEVQADGWTDVMEEPSQGGCTTMLEDADASAHIDGESSSGNVPTCYHALIHYGYLVIEVTRRHIESAG